ncbi:hypothetical protein RIB2604_00402140 [Aspergillus luchuensis]|uniref:magnesium chelatase n=1 Tax=Aspergillus kawachii TaxID=1069201 RepID=A0A146EZV2_ASPKA|nr:hypothetical protein RIB2604_00402140 [Aspergillus luchuensis]
MARKSQDSLQNYLILNATSLEDFRAELLPPGLYRSSYARPSRSRMTTESAGTISSYHDLRDHKGRLKSAPIEHKQEVVNVVIAKHFNHVDDNIQREALENDYLFISHFHDTEDGYVYLEESNDWLSDGQLSASSVIHKPEAQTKKGHPHVDSTLLEQLQQLSTTVSMGAEIARLLAVLHGIDFLTPSIVSLAARKVFRHRIIVAKPEEDRSLQYGSDLHAVSQVLEYANPDSILDGVLTLEAPL